MPPEFPPGFRQGIGDRSELAAVDLRRYVAFDVIG
jgi:hypothetical protein